jgi:rhodanese-related sulfurtransferase
VSGSLEVRAATGAEVVAPVKGAYRFPHRGMAEGHEIELGGVVLRAMETPGHTPEHLAYLLSESGRPVAVFTGGSLLLGGAGRTDLFGENSTDDLTRAQFRSLRRLADLPDQARVLPTHGAGSFCVATAPSQQAASTIGQQRRDNPAMLAADEDGFVRQQLRDLLRYPSYYRHMAPTNRAGPTHLGGLPNLRALSAADVDHLARSGTWIVDIRDRWSFAAAHVPGSINVELDDMFASFVGWVVPFGAPIVLVVPDGGGRHGQEALTQLLRIGYERVEGVIPGSVQRFVGDLPGRVDELPKDRDIRVICRSGHRAAIAASLLDRAGSRVRLVAHEGVEQWLALSPASDEVRPAARRCGCPSFAAKVGPAGYQPWPGSKASPGSGASSRRTVVSIRP